MVKDLYTVHVQFVCLYYINIIVYTVVVKTKYVTLKTVKTCFIRTM